MRKSVQAECGSFRRAAFFVGHGVKVGPGPRDPGTRVPPQSLKVGPQEPLQSLKVGPPHLSLINSFFFRIFHCFFIFVSFLNKIYTKKISTVSYRNQ